MSKNNRYHKPSSKEKKQLRLKRLDIFRAASYYDRILADGITDYIYKDDDQLKVLPVKYGRENFRHLTGISDPGKKPIETFNDWLKQDFYESNYLIEPGNITFQKLKVLSHIRDLATTDAIELDEFTGIEQAKRIKFDAAIKDKSNKVMLALNDFNPYVFQPRSLLNLNATQEIKKRYAKVPEHAIIAVLNSTNNDIGGVRVTQVNVDTGYVQTEEQLQQLLDITNRQATKDSEIVQMLNPNRYQRDYIRMLTKDDQEVDPDILRKRREAARRGMER